MMVLDLFNMCNQSDRQTILNFHGIGTPERAYEAGEEPYWISTTQFEEILGFISSEECTSAVSITFDDGNLSDLKLAVPRLQAHGLSARFFVLSGKLNTPGYLGEADLHSLLNEGMGIGSHGMNHVDWTSLAPADLSSEITIARQHLQEVIGQPIDQAAIPFGIYNRKVIQALKKAAFKKVFTSDGGSSHPSWWLQPRTSIRKDTSLTEIKKLVASGIGFKRELKRDIRALYKKNR